MDDSEPEPFTRFPEGTTIWVSDREDRRIWPPYQIRSADGDVVAEFEEGDYHSITYCAAIIDRYGDVTSTDEESLVPVEVAVDGKPALATYLYGVLAWSREEIAEEFDVKEESVRKYLQRFRPRRKRVD